MTIYLTLATNPELVQLTVLITAMIFGARGG